MAKEKRSIIPVGIAKLKLITVASGVILQLLYEKLGVTVKVSYKPEISRYKGWLRKTGSQRGAYGTDGLERNI